MAIKLVGQDGSPVKYQGKDVFSSDYSGVIKGVDMTKRTLSMIGTDETRDRDGDIIRLSGWNLDNYKKNPVFLWAHNYGSVPLARAEKIIKKKDPPRMEFLLQFPTKGLYPFADMILELYHEKIINASSVGFIPMKWKPIEEDNKDSNNRVQYGREYTTQELLELSGCPVPSNPSAIQNALKGKSFGFKQDDLLKYMTGATLIPRPEKEDDIVDELDKSETEIVDETVIQVQVTENLASATSEGKSEGEDPPAEPPPVTEEFMEVPNLETGGIDQEKFIPADDPSILKDGEELKPYPNEHACRLIDPSEFDKYARKNCFRKVADKCVDYIFGIKDNKSKVQALRFDSKVWTEAGAKAVCERVGGRFDAAKPSKEVGEERGMDDQMKEMMKKMYDMMGVMQGSMGKIEGMPAMMEEMNKTMADMKKLMETMMDNGKDFQESLAKALEDVQRKSSNSSSILTDAFAQAREKAEAPPTGKYSKESLGQLKDALLEVAKAMKKVNI